MALLIKPICLPEVLNTPSIWTSLRNKVIQGQRSLICLFVVIVGRNRAATPDILTIHNLWRSRSTIGHKCPSQYVLNRTGSPTFWTCGLSFLGHASPRVFWRLDPDSRVQPGPASPWIRESQLKALLARMSRMSEMGRPGLGQDIMSCLRHPGQVVLVRTYLCIVLLPSVRIWCPVPDKESVSVSINICHDKNSSNRVTR